VYDRVTARLDRRNARAATMVLTNSEQTRRNIRRHYRRDAAVCYLGVDAARFAPDAGAGGPDYVLSVGAIEPHKGYDFLIRSLALLPERSRPRLIIAGNTDSGGHGQYLRRVAGARGVRLELLTDVPHQRIVELYRGARAFVYAPHQEPFGLAVLEAMACALPVVAVAEGGPRETVVHEATGLLAPRDEEAFAGALARIVGDPVLARALGGAGRQQVESHWTWEAAADRAEEHLAALAAGRGAAHAASAPAVRAGGAQP
jgi:glycosyltransferase involved in cell wall biosynthesis